MSRIQRKDTFFLQQKNLHEDIRRLREIDMAAQAELEAMEVAFDTRLDSLESSDIALDNRLDILEASVLFEGIDELVSTSSTTYVALTGNPQVTITVSGVYIVEIGAYMRNSGAGTSALMSYAIGSPHNIAAIDGTAAQVDSGVASNGSSASFASETISLNAGTIISARYRASANTATFLRRWIKATRKS